MVRGSLLATLVRLRASLAMTRSIWPSGDAVTILKYLDYQIDLEAHRQKHRRESEAKR